jgi:hypothetical protein
VAGKRLGIYRRLAYRRLAYRRLEYDETEKAESQHLDFLKTKRTMYRKRRNYAES